MSDFTCVLLGDESLTIACGARLIERGARILAVSTLDGAVQGWAEGQGLRVVPALGDLVRDVPEAPDWLISAANLRILPAALLDWPARGAVNFHDGPLPEVAGVNAPVWAILGGHSGHGITWHHMIAAVDAGDIVAERRFDMPPEVTAEGLNARCYAEGLDAFGEVMDALASASPRRQPQRVAGPDARRYTRADMPPNAGYLDFSGSVQAGLRLMRALDFGSHANPLASARIMTRAGPLMVTRAEPAEGGSATDACGEVLDMGEGWLRVRLKDGALRLSGLRGMDGRLRAPEISVGEVLPRPEPDVDVIGSLARHEDSWRAVLTRAEPAALPVALPAAAMGKAPEWQVREVKKPEGLDEAEALRRIARWAAQGAGGDGYLAYCSAVLARQAARAPHEIAPWVPLATDNPGAMDALGADQGMAADLGLRLPGSPGLAVPPVGLWVDAEGAPPDAAAPIPGTAVTVIWPDGRLMIDAARVPGAAADLLVERLEEALASDVSPGDSKIPTADRRRLDRWQGAPVTLSDAETVHGAITSQAARTPDAAALIFEDRSLSYAALDARSDAVAAALTTRGVGAGARVALCLSRSPDMVIAALGILKSGAAYVPLDPDYPAGRLAHAVTDSEAALVLTEAGTEGVLDGTDTPRLRMDEVPQAHAPVRAATALDHPAYLIYTSGSTGTPKGVVVTHRNVANFRAGMDAHVTAGPGDRWLAVTSLAFDISVLELFHTLSRGVTVVLSGGEARAAVAGSSRLRGGKGPDSMKFGLYYWGNDGGSDAGKYHLLLEGAKFADRNGFASLWTPERHFHAFGGAYPNPSVTGAAVAAVTERLDVRAGSCVAPLHHPARIAEEWAVIDNMTGGRAGIAFASGWQPDDFILRPENTPPANKPALYDTLEKVRALWRGDAVDFPTATGGMHAAATYPRPVQPELPVWITTAGNPETWREAGAMGAHVLTHLLGQTIDEVEGKIALYHAALREAGHDPADFDVTMLLHTYVAESRDAARETARGPMKDYLRSAAGLIKQYAWAFPAFKKPKGVDNPAQIDLGALEEAELEAILDFAFERYFDDAGLFGTVEDAAARADQLSQIGITEIACLIDYGIDAATVLDGLRPLAEVLRRTNAPDVLDEDDFSLAAQIIRHDVRHLQCTPSMARLLAMNPDARRALGRLRHLYLGGEALPGDLVADLRRAGPMRICNMYGPTETTIWSTVAELDGTPDGTASIGAPIANTQCHVLDDAGRVQPIGVPGQLWIGGAGVAEGYWKRPDLTGRRFRECEGLPGGRLYDTGDLAAWQADGTLAYLGRGDGQVKIRGHRIELGEIEARIAAHPEITGAVVTADGQGGDIRLNAWITAAGPVDEADLRAALARHLPPAMLPAQITELEAFPLTPNKKIDRAALSRVAPRKSPEPQALEMPRLHAPSAGAEPPRGDLAARLAAIWADVLGLETVQPGDNFFSLGGHSLLAVQMHRDIRAALPDARLTITDVFRFPVLADLAAHLAGPAPQTTPETIPVIEDGRAAIIARRRAMRAARGKVAS